MYFRPDADKRHDPRHTFPDDVQQIAYCARFCYLRVVIDCAAEW